MKSYWKWPLFHLFCFLLSILWFSPTNPASRPLQTYLLETRTDKINRGSNQVPIEGHQQYSTLKSSTINSYNFKLWWLYHYYESWGLINFGRLPSVYSGFTSSAMDSLFPSHRSRLIPSRSLDLRRVPCLTGAKPVPDKRVGTSRILYEDETKTKKYHSHVLHRVNPSQNFLFVSSFGVRHRFFWFRILSSGHFLNSKWV